MINANNCKYLIIGTIVVLVCVVLFSNNNLPKPCLNCGDNNEQPVPELEQEELGDDNNQTQEKEENHEKNDNDKQNEIEGFGGNDYASI